MTSGGASARSPRFRDRLVQVRVCVRVIDGSDAAHDVIIQAFSINAARDIRHCGQSMKKSRSRVMQTNRYYRHSPLGTLPWPRPIVRGVSSYRNGLTAESKLLTIEITTHDGIRVIKLTLTITLTNLALNFYPRTPFACSAALKCSPFVRNPILDRDISSFRPSLNSTISVNTEFDASGRAPDVVNLCGQCSRAARPRS